MKTSKKPLKRGKPLAQRSAKQQRAYRGDENNEGRAALVARLLAERPVCQAGGLRAVAAGYSPDQRELVGCTVRSDDVHEILPRSAGGSISDEVNLICVCRADHDWLHRNPVEAKKLGLLRSRYPGRNKEPETDR